MSFRAEMLVPCSNSEHDLRSSYDNLLVVPAMESVTYGESAFIALGPIVCGTICQKRSGVVVVCHPSRLHLKHICSNSRLWFNIISSKYFLVTLNCVGSGYILGELFLISRKSLYMSTTYYPGILFYMCIFLVAMNL